MGYKPNVDAAFWLAKDIFPSIARRVPEARLLLVGHDTRHRLRPLADGHRIVAPGSVADVTPLVGEAAVSVAPVRAGSGTRIKILEALALGVPVVSTTLGRSPAPTTGPHRGAARDEVRGWLAARG